MNLVTICMTHGAVRCWSAVPGERPVMVGEVIVPDWLEICLGNAHLDPTTIETFRRHPEIYCPKAPQ